MKIEITTKQFNVLFQALNNYSECLELDAAGLGRLDSREAHRKAEAILQEVREVEELIQHLRQY